MATGGKRRAAPFPFTGRDWSGALRPACHNTTFMLGFNEWNSPDGSFSTVDEVMARVELHDARWLKSLGCSVELHPHITIAREIKDNNAFASPRSQPGKQNTYVEVGIRPETSFDVTMGRQWHLN